jgi:hypothetical protein
MIKPTEMDEKVTFYEQLEENTGPVILINKFNVKPEEADQFLKIWAAVAKKKMVTRKWKWLQDLKQEREQDINIEAMGKK